MNAATSDQRAGHVTKILLSTKQRRQADLAEHLGMDTGTMSRTIAGKRKWTLSEIERAAEFFDVSVAVFFDDPETLVRSRCFAELAPTLMVA